MTAVTGKNLFLSFAGTVLDTDYRSFSVSEEGGSVDESAGSDTRRTYLTTLTDGNASATVVFQSDGTVLYDAVAPLTEGTLVYALEGSAAGERHTDVKSFVTSREISMEYADLMVVDLEFQFNGTPSSSTY